MLHRNARPSDAPSLASAHPWSHGQHSTGQPVDHEATTPHDFRVCLGAVLEIAYAHEYDGIDR